MIGIAAFLAGAAGTALATGVLGAPQVGDAERAKIEAVVRDYILAHPEIIPEAMEKLQQREISKVVDTNRSRIETPFASAWAGNERGDATLTIFFDYACGYCRASLPDIERLLKEDKQLKVVFRELPILSETSELAARASLAAAAQGKFKAFHDALYAAGRPTPQTIERVQKEVGIDISAAAKVQTSPEASREIEGNVQLARDLRFSGTPSWVVGDQILNGAVGYDTLKKAIAEARKKG
ncbi:DsbA family protein [Sphingomonas colocasiae]|uniref:DsbA family protein n=1 Tax=Sphingomonas colocasiae TaxID=1848973 RepID=A0ABS7PX06_9SPHN|nr:DsbA family protein [Sphingomonas colocasiae]MBY8825890.1 DsbA family protein [Sphingomonas colocasiae]